MAQWELQKGEEVSGVPNIGELGDSCQNTWAVIMDNRYSDFARDTHAIVTTDKALNGVLSVAYCESNHIVLRKYVIFEKIFVWFCSYGQIDFKWRRGESKFDFFFSLA